MRTLSARILLGFAVVTITFGVITSITVWNLSQIEDQASLILRGYVPLALAAGDLARKQEDIKNYLDQGLPDATGEEEVKRWLGRFKTARDKLLTEMARPMDVVKSLADTRAYAATTDSKLTDTIETLSKDVEDELPMFATLTAHPPIGIPPKGDPNFHAAYNKLDPDRRHAYDVLEQLRDSEAKITLQVNKLAGSLSSRTARTKDWLADNERLVRNRAIYLGLTAVLLGMLVTTWVVITLRPLRRLREGARRIAAGDYGSRIEERGPTEVADLAREFNSMGRAVQEREAEKERAARLAIISTMAANIAHEVGNPLTVISFNTEELLDHIPKTADEPREAIRNILREVQRLTELTETYLGMRSGQPRLARESLNAIVGDLVGFVRGDLATKQVIVETELASVDPIGNVDANQIRQCLINLVRNAADAVATNNGGHVWLRTKQTGDRVVIEVADDGRGIPPEVLPKLFEPFFSTKEKGSGLGLALSQQIVRDHGGDLTVASTVGRGTTFSINLPAA